MDDSTEGGARNANTDHGNGFLTGIAEQDDRTTSRVPEHGAEPPQSQRRWPSRVADGQLQASVGRFRRGPYRLPGGILSSPLSGLALAPVMSLPDCDHRTYRPRRGGLGCSSPGPARPARTPARHARAQSSSDHARTGSAGGGDDRCLRVRRGGPCRQPHIGPRDLRSVGLHASRQPGRGGQSVPDRPLVGCTDRNRPSHNATHVSGSVGDHGAVANACAHADSHPDAGPRTDACPNARPDAQPHRTARHQPNAADHRRHREAARDLPSLRGRR